MNLNLFKETCRICLREDDVGNLIYPCPCTGVYQFAHLKCLGNESACGICSYTYIIHVRWHEKYMCMLSKMTYIRFLMYYGLMACIIQLVCWGFDEHHFIFKIPVYQFIAHLLTNLPFFVMEWAYCIQQKRNYIFILFTQLCMIAVIFSIPINIIVYVPLLCILYIEIAKYLYSKHLPSIMNYYREVCL